MKALIKAAAEPGLWLGERVIPQIGPDDVLIKVNKTGICGTDIHIYAWDEWAQRTVPVPMVVGNEYAGEIAEVGANVTQFTIEHRVSGDRHVVRTTSRRALGG